MVKIQSLEHVAVAYRDTDAAAKWYCDVLGFEIALRFNNPGNDANIYFIRDPRGTGHIEIIPMPGGDDTQLADIRTAHVHLAFNVDDMEEAVAELESRGCETGRSARQVRGKHPAFLPRPGRRAAATGATGETALAREDQKPISKPRRISRGGAYCWGSRLNRRLSRTNSSDRPVNDSRVYPSSPGRPVLA